MSVGRRWQPAFNPLLGIATPEWWRLLRDNDFRIAPEFAHRAALISFASLCHVVDGWRELRRFGAAIAEAPPRPDPLFIVGHWRTGSTWLHHLLAQDTENFVAPKSFEVANPHDYLVNEWLHRRLYAHWVPKQRPMDQVPISHDTPEEDEWATCLLSLRSYYLSFFFPERERFYRRYLTFRGVEPRAIEEWKSAFVYLLKKLAVRSDRMPLLKSPPHTARIHLLLNIVPRARFIHLRRHPLAVYQSMRHLRRAFAWHTTLQRLPAEADDEAILGCYTELHDAWSAGRRLIPRGRLVEVAFEDLESAPLAEIARVYRALELPGFDRARPRFETHLAATRGYKKNAFAPLGRDEQQRVFDAWQRSFDEWNYRLPTV